MPPAIRKISGALTGLTRLVADRGPAGRMIRTLLPAAILIPIALRWLRLEGQRAGLYSHDVGAMLNVAGNAAAIMLIVLWNARLLHIEDAERRKAEDGARQLARRDVLTGLANRASFMDRLVRRAAMSERRASPPFAVLYLDLDGFKRINDRLGSEAGDRLLVKIGAVIQDCVRGGDLVARVGGDEFAILLEELADSRDATLLANRIAASIQEALTASGAAIAIGVSIGVALNGPAHSAPDDILRDAEAALLEVKASERGRALLASPAHPH